MGDLEKNRAFYCQACNAHMMGEVSWQLHVESKNHLKKLESQQEFKLNEDELYVDEDSQVARIIAGFKGPLLGVECIVEDKTSRCAKCLLCRTIIKEMTSVIDHMRTSKHQQLYLETYHSLMFKDAQIKSQRDGTKFGQMLNRLVLEVSRKCAEQKPKVYEQGVLERFRKFFETGGQLTGSAVELHFLKKLGSVSNGSDRNSDSSMKMDIADENDLGLDVFEELPTAAEVKYTLLTSEMVHMGPELSYIHKDLRNIEEPVVGLEFVPEYCDPLREYEPGYFCTICESRLSPKQCLGHVVSQRHRLQFLEAKCPEKFARLHFERSEDRRNELLMKYLVEIEEAEGRGLIALRIALPPKMRDSVFALHRKLDQQNQSWDGPSRRVVESNYERRQVNEDHRSNHRYQDARIRGDGDRNRHKYTIDERHYRDDQRHSRSPRRREQRSSRDPHDRYSRERRRDTRRSRSKSRSNVCHHSEQWGQREKSPMTGNEEYGQYSVDHNVDSYEGFGVPENQYAVEQLSFSHSNMYANQMVPDPIDSAGCYDQPQLSTPTVVPRSYFRDGTSQEASFSTEDIEFRPAGSMKRFQTAAKAARRSRSPISGKSPKMEKPTFVYSEKEEQNRKLRDLERRLPTGCDRNVKAGWFSVRQYSIDFLERIAQPTKTEGDEGGETMGSSPFLYFSFRSPNARKDFYENWNSQLLRRIQDKFNFKLNHMMWLKTLITDHKIPLDVPLTLKHLEPLQEEVETAVLNELIGAVLVPNENKGKAVVHLIEYRPDCRSQTRPVEPETKLIDYSAPNVPSEFSIPPPNFALLRMHALPAAPHATQQQPSLLNSSQVGRLNAGLLANFTSFAPAQATTSKTVKSSEIPVVTLDSDTESRKNNSNPPCSSTQLSIEDEAKAAAEQKSRQAAISQLVEQIIVTAKHNDQRNPVLKMLLSFANPKAILIQLATKQPQTLQQFISVIRNPNLNVPQELLEVLHAKLTALAEQTEAKIPSKSSVEEYDPSKPLRDESSKRSESHKRDRRDDRKDESEEKRRKKLKQLEILERVEQYRKLKDSAKPKLTAAVDDISKVSVAADKAPAPFEVVNSRIMPVPSAHYQDFMPTGDGSAAGFNIGDPSQSYWPPFPYPQQMLGFPGVNPVFPNLFMGGFRPPFS